MAHITRPPIFQLDESWTRKMKIRAPHLAIRVWTVQERYRVRWRGDDHKGHERSIAIEGRTKSKARELADRELHVQLSKLKRQTSQKGTVKYTPATRCLRIEREYDKKLLCRIPVNESIPNGMEEAMVIAEEQVDLILRKDNNVPDPDPVSSNPHGIVTIGDDGMLQIEYPPLPPSPPTPPPDPVVHVQLPTRSSSPPLLQRPSKASRSKH